jgi:hypothetical protein
MGALFGAEAPRARRIVDALDPGVPLVGWATLAARLK